jgi:hypothetical protein
MTNSGRRDGDCQMPIAKVVLQVYGIAANEKVIGRKQFRLSRVMAFLKTLSSRLVGTDAN